MTEGVTIAVAGAKGGVGKTTTSINLGTIAVDATVRSVLLVDGDLAMANVFDFLDLPFDPETDPSLHDVLAGRATVDEAVVRASSGLSVLPSGGSLDGFASTRADSFVPVLESVRSTYDLTVVDTAAGISRETLLPMGVADGVVLVSTPRISAIRDTQKTIELVERVGGTPSGIVINMTGSGSAPSSERLAEFLGVALLGDVPDDEAIARAQDQGQAVVDYDERAPSARGFFAAATKLGLVATDAPTPSVESSGPESV